LELFADRDVLPVARLSAAAGLGLVGRVDLGELLCCVGLGAALFPVVRALFAG
jgi:hypothetical protein